MRPLREEQRVGIDALECVTRLLQRVRAAHPTSGLYEAADLQWWWRTPRATDDVPQLVWFDELGQPGAAVVVTAWNDRIALDPMVLPDADPDWLAHVMRRGLAHAHALGFQSVSLEVDHTDDVLRDVLMGHGFELGDDVVVEAWLAADDRPPISVLHEGYRLSDRVATIDCAHHMINAERGPPTPSRACGGHRSTAPTSTS